MSTKQTELAAARDQVVAARVALDEHAAKLHEHDAMLRIAEYAVRDAEVARDTVRAQGAGLRATLAKLETTLGEAENVAVEALAVSLAGEIIRRQASDPVRNASWVVMSAQRLRGMVRSAIDVPVNQQTEMHPVVVQALNLLPPRNPFDVPVYELGAAVPSTSWPARRRQILVEACLA